MSTFIDLTPEKKWIVVEAIGEKLSAAIKPYGKLYVEYNKTG
jgi:hypothetical protein